MRHPFDLDISELEKLGLCFEELSYDQSEKVTGGYNYFLPPELVSLRVQDVFTTLALSEEGGDDSNQNSGTTTTRKDYTSPDGRTKSTEVVTNSWRSNFVTS
jgi:hypothetical protein